MLVTNTMYSIIRGDIRGDYEVFVASWGDDLGGDLVPHVSRVGLGTLHFGMSHNCSCTCANYVRDVVVCLVNICDR